MADERHGTDKGRSWRLLANLFIGAGVNHFVMPRAYEQIVPPRLQAHAKRIVQVSGVAEIAGGVGVLVPATGAGADRVVGGGVSGERVHGACPRALPSDTPLGAVRALAVAAADDAVGVAGDATMRSLSHAVRARAAMFD
jgi:hypothetical protein